MLRLLKPDHILSLIAINVYICSEWTSQLSVPTKQIMDNAVAAVISLRRSLFFKTLAGIVVVTRWEFHVYGFQPIHCQAHDRQTACLMM